MNDPQTDHPFPLPADEMLRLAALQSCRVLDMPQQKSLRGLTELASTVFNVPVSLISVIDTDRQVMLAIEGADVAQMPRSTSFCTYALLNDDILFVPDASADIRFADNPLVANAPHLRFYAGAPLLDPSGYKIGTFCILDHVPRADLTTRERRMLRGFADIAAEIISTQTETLRFWAAQQAPTRG